MMNGFRGYFFHVLGRLYEALKPGGILVLADHSDRPGDGANVTKSLDVGIEESVVRRELEAAGFQFVAEGNFLRNPADLRISRCKRTPSRTTSSRCNSGSRSS